MIDASLVTITKADAEMQIVYGEVYVPGVPDSHNEYMTQESVYKAAHGFLKNHNVHNVDKQHDNMPTGAYVVESFIARKGDPDFIEGSWVVGVHIPDADLWEQVKKGELNGFSLQALVTKTLQEVEVTIPEMMEGETEAAEDGHTHRFVAKFDDDGSFVGGETDSVDGHTHTIVKGTRTEESNDHHHRFAFVELMLEAGQDG